MKNSMHHSNQKTIQTPISVNIEARTKQEAIQVQKAFEAMHTHFKSEGIIKMTRLFLKDAFIRNLVKMKINKT